LGLREENVAACGENCKMRRFLISRSAVHNILWR